MIVKRFIKLIILLFLLILSFGENFAQIPTQELIQEQHTAKETRQWLFRQTKNGDIFPFLRTTRDKVEFLNVDYQVIAEYNYLPLSNVKSSPNCEVVAFIERLSDETAINDRKFLYHVVGFDGSEIFSLPVTCISDEPFPEIYVSDRGDALLVDGAKGEVKVFRSKAEPEKIIDLFSDDVYNFEKPIDAAISGNGKYFSVVAQRQPSFYNEDRAEYVSGEPYLFLFSINGQEKWRRALDLDNGSSTAISSNGYYVVVSHYSSKLDGATQFRTSIYSASGKEMLDLPIKFRLCKFSNDEKTLFVADRRNLYRIDLPRKQYIRTPVFLAEKDRLIVDFTLQSRERTNVLTGKAYFATDHFEFGELKILQLSKNKVTTYQLDSKDDSMIFPSIFAIKDKIAIGLKNSTKIFKDRRE